MANENKKIRQGIVVSNKMDKTGVVEVQRMYNHPLYKKRVKSSKKYKFHDAENTVGIGDVVKVIECRPLSKDKRWRLLEVVKKAI